MSTTRKSPGAQSPLAAVCPPQGNGQYVYILECSDHTLYTGWTTDIARRLKAHNGEGSGGAKCTRARRPVRLVYFECFEEKSAALSREAALKRLSRAEKLALICGEGNTEGTARTDETTENET